MRFRDRAFIPLAIAIGAGAVAGFAILPTAPSWCPPMVRIVALYDTCAVAMLAFYWSAVILRSDAAATRARAASEDPGRNVAFAVVLLAVAFGFIAAFDVLLPAHNGITKPQAAVIYALGFAAVILGWFLIHTLFIFRYARLYYERFGRNDKGGGLVFPGSPEPRDLDFAYFSFVLGMTFQVSDVQITDPRIRTLAMVHGLVSFGYNTAILALVVNLVAGLLH